MHLEKLISNKGNFLFYQMKNFIVYAIPKRLKERLQYFSNKFITTCKKK